MAKKITSAPLETTNRKSPSYCELFCKAMELWRTYHDENLVDEYFKAQDDKIKAGLPIRERPRQAIFAKYSKGAFLSIKDEEKAKSYLYPMTDKQVQAVIDKVNRYLNSEQRKALRAFIQDFHYETRRAKMPKDRLKCGISPSACSGNGKRANSHKYSDSI